MGNGGDNHHCATDNPGTLDVYVDASFCPTAKAAGLGGLLLDAKGEVVGDFTTYRKAGTSFDAEKNALLQGIQRAKKRNANRIRVFSDCKTLVTSIQRIRSKANAHRIRPIDRRLRQVVDAIEAADATIAIKHVGRANNQAADGKAREGLKAARAKGVRKAG